MSIRDFICPDAGRIPVKDCLKEGGCRMKERCATRSYLLMCSSERRQKFKCTECKRIETFEPTNKNFNKKCLKCGAPSEYMPSTTQLIKGTKQAFLELTQDFDVAPDDRAFMILGTKAHAKLESFDDEYSMLEQKLSDEDTTGISDVIEQEDGKNILADYKTTGSYKVAKALGFQSIDEPSGEIYKSGKRKGQEKMKKVLKRDDKYIDRRDWELQLNKYRIMIEKEKGIKIHEIKIQAVVRDGNTYIARSRGVFRNIYYFKLDILPDDYVNGYFKRKRNDLLTALKQGRWNTVCSKEEIWDGIKCQRYCSVAEYCPVGKYLKEEKKNKEAEMAIKGLSEIRRLPRMGKIRLGIMVEGNGKTYPKEVDYFILDPATENETEKKNLINEFHRLYGDKPKQINIMFPVADKEKIFPQYYKSYGKSTMLNCKGDGETAVTSNEDYKQNLEVIGKDEFGLTKVKCRGKECPYYTNNACRESASLSVLLPDLAGAGVWQITTGSFNSILNLNSCLDYVRSIAGRFHMIPLVLERREQKIKYEGKTASHWVLHIDMKASLSELQRLGNIDPQKITMDIPEIEDDRKDIVFQTNESVNEPIDAEVVEEGGETVKEAVTDKQESIAADLEILVKGCKTSEELDEAVIKNESIVKSLPKELRSYLNGVVKSVRLKIEEGGK